MPKPETRPPRKKKPAAKTSPGGSTRGNADGATGLLHGDRAMRAREVSKPSPADEAAAEISADELLARLDRRRQQ